MLGFSMAQGMPKEWMYRMNLRIRRAWRFPVVRASKSFTEKGLDGFETPQGSSLERITLVRLRAMPQDRHSIAIIAATNLHALASEQRS